ncbi:MAG: M23 family metallopeptidase [Bacteroidetes bacterium]|jgi:murein DD-endopeptidase MepM/ murein hydrolase activator NlpD|nr:M23 family metallopeptidase [Bacteroidota bacterium]MBT6685377.1 M23 family metallopeptidase [Bacteroidota bacterium]MBT7145043.1 M23 family metallopeptidase [Bacteroidota bacterium]MBT7492728.1 M23 family metallopeptidase [Bacteroidota bacterium]
MEQSQKDKKLIKKLKNKYHLKIYNENTFEEVFSFRLSRLNVFASIGFSIIILIALVTVLIAFTGLREFIPGYPDGNMRRMIISNALKVDSLNYQLKLKDQYFQNLKNIIEGKEPVVHVPEKEAEVVYSDIKFERSKEDSALRRKIENEAQYNITAFENNERANVFSNIHFYKPVSGLIISKFEKMNEHFGIDIVSEKDAVVSSTLPGTVIIATWSIENGYIIQIQHENDLLSIYKHNSKLFKNVGDEVSAGEAIAIVGDSGELSSGPHLHFELWHNGIPLDPQNHIVF